MGVRALLALVLCFSFTPTTLKADEGFFDLDSLPKNHRLKDEQALKRAWDATFKIYTYGVPDLKRKTIVDGIGSCSAAWISEDGYFLTALHCITGVLALTGYLEFVPIGLSTRTPMVTYRVKHRQPKLDDIPFLIEIDGTTAQPATANLIAVGSGFSSGLDFYKETEFWEVLERETPAIRMLSQDYAILKVNLAKGNKVPCLSMQENLFERGDVWALGYPGRTRRPRLGLYNNTNGREKVVTYGKLMVDIEHSPFWKPILEKVDSEKRTLVKASQALADILLSNADAMNGMSGGPTINERGEIIGVNSRASVMSRTQFVPDTTYSVRASSIVIDIEGMLGEEKKKEVFNCPKPTP